MSLSGLSAREAEASLQKYGLNERTIEISFGDYFIGGLTSLSCKLFVIAAMIKIIALLLGLLEVIPPVKDVTGIFVAVGLALLSALFEATVHYVTDKRTRKICTDARQCVYTVLRGQKTELVEEKKLAVGDTVYLSAGDIIPADGIVADGNFTVDQSEFGTLEKIEKTTPPATFHGSKAVGLKNPYSLYKGSVITDGSGAMRITATGDNTLVAGKTNDNIKIHGGNFSTLICAGGIIGAVCAGAVLIFCVVYGVISSKLVMGLLEGFSTAAAILALSSLCGKNLIVEAAAANVMNKLERKGVKISKPDVLNDMESVKIVFVDKAGSYTDGNYIVNGFIDGAGNQIEKLDDINEKVAALIKAAAVNTSTAYIDSDNNVYGGNSVDRAILNYVKRVSGKAKVKKQAFVQKNGISGVEVNLDGKAVTFISGSAEFILKKCFDSFSANGKKRRITNKDALVKLAATISLTGNDVIALAVCDRTINDNKLPTGSCTLIGMIVVHDKALENIADDLDYLEKNSIKTILMTSASRESTIYALKKSGKKGKGVILSSEQLARMNNNELAKRFSDIRAIVSADFADKMRIVKTAAEQNLKSCAVCSDYDGFHILDETDAAVASPVCLSAICSASDASSEVSGLTAAAMIHRGAVSFRKQCVMFGLSRILCAVIFAAMAVISIIGW